MSDNYVHGSQSAPPENLACLGRKPWIERYVSVAYFNGGRARNRTTQAR